MKWAVCGKKMFLDIRNILVKVFLFSFVLSTNSVFAQDGFAAATTQIKGYFPKAILLMYAVGALCGIIGAIKVYNKWNQGDQDTSKVASAWFGSCIFLIVVATVLKGFFGV